MNRYLALFLVLGIGFWAVFAYRIALNGKLIGNHTQSIKASPAELMPNSKAAVSDSQLKNLRNPFFMPKTANTLKTRVVKSVNPIQAAKAPLPYTLDAILPGDKPLAILRNGSATVIAGPGQKAWDATVVKVESSLVQLEFRGSEYELRK